MSPEPWDVEDRIAVQHQALWMGLLDMARWVRYYDFSLSKSKRWRDFMRVALALSSTGAVLSLSEVTCPQSGTTSYVSPSTCGGP